MFVCKRLFCIWINLWCFSNGYRVVHALVFLLNSFVLFFKPSEEMYDPEIYRQQLSEYTYNPYINGENQTGEFTVLYEVLGEFFIWQIQIIQKNKIQLFVRLSFVIMVQNMTFSRNWLQESPNLPNLRGKVVLCLSSERWTEKASVSCASLGRHG